MLVGVAGKKRHGKDSVSRILFEKYSIHRTAFADNLKRVAMEVWGLTFDQVYDEVLKETIDPRWGVTPRFILQQFGTEVGRNIHKDTWVRSCLDQVKRGMEGQAVWVPQFHLRVFGTFTPEKGSSWSICDVRFEDEAKAIRDAGGIILKVDRPSEVSHDTHTSETSVDLIEPDHLIINDGTLADLEAKVCAAIRPSSTVKRMSIREFMETGYLHEVNRKFLHPHGLALEVIEDSTDGSVKLGGVWDYRDDPEGMAFSEDTLSPAKAGRVQEIEAQRAEARTKALGYWVQPVGEQKP